MSTMFRLTRHGCLGAKLFLLSVSGGCSGEVLGPAESFGSQPAAGGALASQEDRASDPGPSPGEASGSAWWDAQCASCHGSFREDSVLSSGNRAGDFRLDARAAVTRHGSALASYIEQTMPLGAGSSCRDECAELTADHIRSHIQPLPTQDCTEATPRAERRLTLLSSREYQRSLEDLLSIPFDYGSSVKNNDGARGGFRNMTGKRVNGAILDQYFRNAEAIARWAVEEGRPFRCDTNCGPRFVSEFLPRVFRGQQTEAQEQRFLQIFEEFGPDAMHVALEAALTSPYFLYRIESGVELRTALDRGWYTAGQSEPSILGGARSGDWVLGPVELASALSFMLTGSGPDEELLAAAESDRLSTESQLRAQVQRLVDSPRGREHIGDLVVQWYGLEELLKVNRPDVPDLTMEVRRAMIEEVRQHFLHVVYGDAPYSEFFDGDYTFLNRTLATHYGVTGDFGSDFARVRVTGRGGPIASGAFMALHAHAGRSAPILRAVHARQDALCHHIDPPNSPLAGDDIDEQRALAQARVAEREQQEGALSSREFYFIYTDGIDACAGCHEKIINPLFGLEDFDHLGRMRPKAGDDSVIETIGGIDRVVSIRGTLFGVDSTVDSTSIDFSGAKDFSNRIANAPALDRCLVRKTFRWATGLPLTERDVDRSQREDLSPERRRAFACMQSELLDSFQRAGEDPRALIIDIALHEISALRR
ncbi:MAG TPA: DUF1592 domain-containing protein [Myxococcales bacterium LLY-WYZ-16_1]|nr:DUF1592 domain-containing protein [Myxococcales bacterium LLY-WYZ-16_1]